MAYTTLVSDRIIPVGKYAYVFVIPTNISYISVRIFRDNWGLPGEKIVELQIDLSLDNGQTWIEKWAGFTAIGGNTYSPIDASLREYSSVERDFPEPQNNQRRMRINLDVLLTLNTRIEAEWRV